MPDYSLCFGFFLSEGLSQFGCRFYLHELFLIPFLLLEILELLLLLGIETEKLRRQGTVLSFSEVVQVVGVALILPPHRGDKCIVRGFRGHPSIVEYFLGY